MRRRALLPIVFIMLLAAFAPVSQARSSGASVPAVRAPMTPIYAGQTTRHYQPVLAPNRHPLSSNGLVTAAVVATSTIQVTYHGFSAGAEAAFQAAVDVWQSEIVSSQVIHVDATWTSLGSNSGILGEAGPTNFFLGSDDRWYPAALYESMCSCNQNSGAEIQAEFNSAFSSWYLGTDGNVPSNKWDFFSVVLHELGHGLGFLSTFDINSGVGSWGWSSGGHVYPTLFDTNEWSAATGGSQMTSYTNNSTALANQLTDGSVYLDGTNLEAALGHRAKLYAPNPWQPGSSNSHLDETAFAAGTADALMTPALNNGEAIHYPGPATLAIFEDIGWTIAGEAPPAPTEPGAPTNAHAVPGNGSADVTWSAPASDGGSAITGYTVTSTPDSQTCQASDATGCTVSTLTNGTAYTFSVTATNDVGPGPASDPSNSVTPSDQPLDTTPPVVSAPSVSIISPQQLSPTATVHVAWPAAADDSGIAAYELQVKQGSGAWADVTLAAPTDTSVDVPAVPGATYTFQLRATDTATNVSGWATTIPAKLARLQEKSGTIAYTGKWRRVRLRGASGRYVRYAGAANRSATLTFTGTSVGFVTTIGPARGIADVWLDGSYVGSVDLYSAATVTQAVAWAPDAPLTAGTHTLEVIATGTRNASATKTRIDVDAFLVWP